MKNLIIILSIILLSSCAVRRNQDNNTNHTKSNKIERYKPLEKFKGDTLSFVQHSILDRKEYYIDKPFSVFLKDYNMPISIYLFSNLPENITLSNSIILYISNFFIRDKKLSKGEDPVTLVVVWKTPINYYEFEEIAKRNNRKWTPEVEQYLSDKIVGNIVKTDYKLKK